MRPQDGWLRATLKQVFLTHVVARGARRHVRYAVLPLDNVCVMSTRRQAIQCPRRARQAGPNLNAVSCRRPNDRIGAVVCDIYWQSNFVFPDMASRGPILRLVGRGIDAQKDGQPVSGNSVAYGSPGFAMKPSGWNAIAASCQCPLSWGVEP